MQDPSVTSIGHKPDGKWAFDEAVTECFDDMLRRSIPQYDVMRSAVLEIATPFVQAGTAIVDLGCSRGDALDHFIRRFGAHNRHVGIECSEPMVQAAKEKFAGYISCGVVDIRQKDLRTYFPADRSSVTLSVLTLQFVPVEYRQQIVRDVYKHLVPGGAFVLVEKILGASADLNSQLVSQYYDLKRANGYTQDEIDTKRVSLEGVLVPLTAKWNEDILRSAGFKQIDCFWRWMNFAGWIAVKD